MLTDIEFVDVSTDETTAGTIEDKLTRLQEIIRPLGRAIVAFSGGTDSTLLLKVAYDVLGDDVLGATAASPSLARADLEETIELAEFIGAPHRLLQTDELENPNYAANPANRCYFCRSVVHDDFRRLANDEGYDYVLDGTNLDDLGDFRPGQTATQERGVRTPLKDAALTKRDVRALARHLGLPNWDKPAAACLSSRIPYGNSVTAEALRQIDAAEAALRDLGFRQLRVRHHDNLARIEVSPDRLDRVLAVREDIVRRLKQAGYTYVTLDLLGYRTGSLNEALKESAE
ncbi:MAG: Pyridinium-3,5-biscarboxylic acid mononucleotide sulfurtransferase [Anaerolineales bacterium]|nr:Pyridinium-3,5-biscarboxylic acid mononucleotide sulfurtransferase [Anaerolineales bacterium]